MDALVECNNLSYFYGKKKVLDDISFSIGSGKIVGLLGPNGCGKTTLIKLMTGMLRDERNSIYIDGNPVGELTKSIVSYSPDRICYRTDSTVQSIIDFYDLAFEDFDKTLACSVLSENGIDFNAFVGKLSKGTAEKFQIILTVSRRAKLYIMDEPFNGIDPVARENIIKMILKYMPEDSSLILSTHAINDVEQILDDALFINNGKMVLNSSVEDVRSESGKSLLELFKEEFR